MSEPRLIEVRRNVLKQNDVIARALRDQFHAAGVFVVSLVSSPGSGKTTFLEKTLTQLQPRYRVAALVGDLATENDAFLWLAARLQSSRLQREHCATWKRRWFKTRYRTGICINSIFSSSRTLAIWSARPPMTWEKIYGWC